MQASVQQIIDANRAISQMIFSCPIPYPVLRQLHRVIDCLRAETSIAADAQNRIIQRLGASVGKNGRLSFPDKTCEEAYLNAWNEIAQSEVALDLTVVDLSALSGDVSFADPNVDLTALSKFVLMEKE